MPVQRGRGRGRGGSGRAAKALESESDLSRIKLRQRWELASVLNFLNVFREVVGGELKMSAEDIETALISCNDGLALIHTAILLGIPPVTENLKDADAWVTELCKKLDAWWPWVAEGENPLEADHGEEIARYRALDPTTRLLILKALCEVRALQLDISAYIRDGLKKGTSVTAFRKEMIGDEAAGITYWCDGDKVLGYRLYRETARTETKRQKKEKGGQPTIQLLWETLATNLKEFRRISDNLSSSQSVAEPAVAEIVKTDVIPVLEKLQRKKRRDLKGQGKCQPLKKKRRQALSLNGSLNSSQTDARHSQRKRKPVKYTFAEYDQQIEKAIQTPKKTKTKIVKNNKRAARKSGTRDKVLDNNMGSDKQNSIQDEDRGSWPDNEHQSCIDNDGGKSDFYGINADDVGKDDSLGDFNEEEDALFQAQAHIQKLVKAEASGLRRSRRKTAPYNRHHFGPAGMKKRLRQRVTPNTNNSVLMVSDSEDESLSMKTIAALDKELVGVL